MNMADTRNSTDSPPKADPKTELKHTLYKSALDNHERSKNRKGWGAGESLNTLFWATFMFVIYTQLTGQGTDKWLITLTQAYCAVISFISFIIVPLAMGLNTSPPSKLPAVICSNAAGIAMVFAVAMTSGMFLTCVAVLNLIASVIFMSYKQNAFPDRLKEARAWKTKKDAEENARKEGYPEVNGGTNGAQQSAHLN